MGYFKSEESKLRHTEARVKSTITRDVNNRKNYNNEPVECLNCSSIIPYEKRTSIFCSRSCSASFNNLGVSRYPEKEYKTCRYCGKKLPRKDSKYCSNICQSTYEFLIFINKWKLKLVTGTNGVSGTSCHIKRYFKLKYNNSCQKCNWSVKNIYTGNVPLELHHIDGDYKHNDEDNLELVCPNCHSLTSTYKAANKNNTRTHR